MRFSLIYNGFLIIEWTAFDLREADPRSDPDFETSYRIVYGGEYGVSSISLWEKHFRSISEAMIAIAGGLDFPKYYTGPMTIDSTDENKHRV